MEPLHFQLMNFDVCAGGSMDAEETAGAKVLNRARPRYVPAMGRVWPAGRG